MDIDATQVLTRAQNRIGELTMEVLTLEAALAQQTAELAEAKAALEAIEQFQAEADAKVVPPDGWGSTSQALRTNEAGYGPVD